MKKQTKKHPSLDMPIDPQKRQEKVLHQLGMMKHKDLVRACVSRGLGFDRVVEYDHNQLGSFFLKNYDTSEDPKLLDEYDSWVENQLTARGYKKGDALLSPFLRLGYVGKGDLGDAPTKIIDPTSKPKKIPETVKVDKSKREKDESTGVVTGTKKNLTYTLAREGKELPRVIELVKKQFPDAQEKSIKIWFKRALKDEQED